MPWTMHLPSAGRNEFGHAQAIESIVTAQRHHRRSGGWSVPCHIRLGLEPRSNPTYSTSCMTHLHKLLAITWMHMHPRKWVPRAYHTPQQVDRTMMHSKLAPIAIGHDSSLLKVETTPRGGDIVATTSSARRTRAQEHTSTLSQKLQQAGCEEVILGGS